MNARPGRKLTLELVLLSYSGFLRLSCEVSLLDLKIAARRRSPPGLGFSLGKLRLYTRVKGQSPGCRVRSNCSYPSKAGLRVRGEE